MENQNEKETPPPPPPILDQLKEYAETQIKLAKYEAIDKSATFLASFITDVIVAIAFILTFFFLSLALAFVLSHWLGAYWEGFGCMAIIYVIIALTIKFTKHKIKPPLVDIFIKKFLKNNG